MAVSSANVRTWLQNTRLPDSPSELSRLTGINRATINNQMRRGNVAEALIVLLSRAVGIDPLTSLASFPQYEDILTRPIPPTSAEVLSQVHYRDLLDEFQYRVKRYPRPKRAKAPELVAIPHEGSHRAWIDAIDTGDLRRHIAAETGMALSYLSTQLSENKLTPPQVVAASRTTGGSFITGLVVISLISPHEGGWPIRAREDALLEVEDDHLLDLVMQRLAVLRRKIKQSKEALEYAERLSELLG